MVFDASQLVPKPDNATTSDDSFDASQLRLKEEDSSSFGESFSRGIDLAQSMAGGAVEATGELIDSESLSEYGREVRERNIEEAEAGGARSRFADIDDAGSFGQWVKETVGEQIPLMAPSLAGGVAGAGAGFAVGGPVGATIGGVLGAFVPALTLGIGEVQSGIKAKDPGAEAPGVAFAGGTAIAALDTVLPGKVGSRLVKTLGVNAAEEIAERALLKPVKNEVVRRTAKGVASGMAVEGVTESLQEAIEEVAAAHGTDQPIDWESLTAQMVEAGAAGALMGGVVSGPVSALPSKPDQQADIEAADRVMGAPDLDTAIVEAEAAVDQIARLAELERKAKGTPDQEIIGEDGKPFLVRGEPPRILTDAERIELRQLHQAAVVPEEEVESEAEKGLRQFYDKQRERVRGQLKDLGYSEDSILQMSEEEAFDIARDGTAPEDATLPEVTDELDLLAPETQASAPEAATDEDLQGADVHEFASTQVNLDQPDAQETLTAARTLIDEEDVHPEEGLEDQPHITVLYGLEPEARDQVSELLSGEGPIEVTVGEVEIFSPEDENYDVVVQRVESEQLNKLHDKIRESVPTPGETFPEYKPHITLGYVKKGTGEKYAGQKTGLEGKTLTFNAVDFMGRDETSTPIPLQEQRETEAGRREQQQQRAQDRFKRSQTPDPTTDSLLTLAAKRGGLNIEAWAAEGVDPEVMRDRRANNKVFGRPAFRRNGGMTPDDLGELMVDWGYASERPTANEVVDFIMSEVNQDDPYFHPEARFQQAERAAEEREADMADYDPTEYDDLTEGMDEDQEAAFHAAVAMNFWEDVDDLNQAADEVEHKRELAELYNEAYDEFERSRVPEEGQAGPAPEGAEGSFALEPETEADRRVREAAERDRIEAEQQRRADEEARISADENLEGFRLTGSDRQADVLAAQGQEDLLAQQEPPGVYSGYERAPTDLQGRPERDQGGIREPGASPGQQAELDLFPAPDENKQQAYADLYGTVVKASPVGEIKSSTDVIQSTDDLAHMMASIRKKAQESVYAVVTDSDGKVLRVIHHTKGLKAASQVAALDIVAEAASVEDAAVLHFVHNHPSGDPSPSESDKRITERIGNMLDGTNISLQDSIVIGQSTWSDVFLENKRPIKPRPRTKSIPITERMFTKRSELGGQVVNEKDAIEMFGDYNDAIILLNNRHAPVGIVHMSAEEMRALREGGRVRRILSAINRTNASAAIVRSSDRESARNVTNMLGLYEGEVRVLYAIVGEPGGPLESLAATGGPPTTGIFFSQFLTSPRKTNTTKAQVEQAVEKDMAQIAENLGINISVMSFDEVPENVKSQVAPGTRPKAYMDGNNAVLIHDHLKNSRDARLAFAHEVKGHIGVNNVIGDKWSEVTADFQKLKQRGKNKTFQSIYAELQDRYGEVDAETEVKEFIAIAAERRVSEGAVGRFMRKVRELLKAGLKALGFRTEFGMTDIDMILSRSERFLAGEDAGIQAEPALQFGYERDRTTTGTDREPEVAERTIGGGRPASGWATSTRILRGGRPAPVYRGSRAGLTADKFDLPALGKASGHPSSGLGVWFTTSQTDAANYGGRTDQYNLDIRNPRIIKVEDMPGFDSIEDAHKWREDIRAQGHDGLIITARHLGGPVHVVAFSPDSVIAAPAQFSQETDFIEENRRIREEDVPLWNRAKRILKRGLSPGGLLPDSVFDLKIERDNELQVVEFDSAHLVGSLERSVKEDFGTKFLSLSNEQKGLIQEALAGRLPEALPQRTKTSVIAMRQYLDAQSQDYIDLLRQEGQDMIDAARRSGGNVEDATAKAGLIDIIASNIGSYVHRSYQVFDDPNWFKQISDDTLNRAREYLTGRMTDGGATLEEAQRRVEVILDDLLKDGTAYDDMHSFVRETKLGAKDLSILTKRKNIAPEIRELLGEYNDARLNFAKSTNKMGRLIWNQRFLNKMREVGMGEFLFTEEERPPGTTQIAADASEVYAPLNGLYTYREVDQALKDALGKENMANWYRMIVQLNGIVKFGKTVLSPTTAARNWQSAMFFSIANGHFRLGYMSKSVQGLREYFTQQGSGEKLAYLRKLKKLGVVYDTPYAGEMMRLLDDSRLENVLNSGKAGEIAKDSLHVAQKFYQYGDDFWKIIGFENEKRSLMSVGFSEAEAEIEAAERVRNTYPTYSMVGRWVLSLRRFPLAGTFVSFPAEIVRTTGNMLRYTAKDMQDPRMRPLALRRAAGLSVAASFAYAAQEISKSLLDMDDDDEEAVRVQAAPWNENSNLIFTGRDEEGNIRYIDVSFVDPYNYWKRPINAMMRNQPWEEMAGDIAREVLTPFLGTDIAAGAIFEVLANKRMDTGTPIYMESASPFDQSVEIAEHLGKALQPGLTSNMFRTYKALQNERSPSGRKYQLRDEGWAWVGWRVSTLDPKTALYYRSYDFKDTLSEASQTLNRALNDPNEISDSEIKSAYDRALTMRSGAYADMIILIKAAGRSGLSKQDIRATLKASRISGSDISDMLHERMPKRWKPSTTSRNNALRRARRLQGAEHKNRVRLRYKVIDEYTSEIGGE